MNGIGKIAKLILITTSVLLFFSCGKNISIMTYNMAQKGRIKNVLIYNKHDVEIVER
jgi:hypothetical protein